MLRLRSAREAERNMAKSKAKAEAKAGWKVEGKGGLKVNERIPSPRCGIMFLANGIKSVFQVVRAAAEFLRRNAAKCS